MKWRDVSIDGYPESACQVLIVRDNKTRLAAWIGDRFWFNNERVAALYWMPLPEPPSQEPPATLPHEYPEVVK